MRLLLLASVALAVVALPAAEAGPGIPPVPGCSDIVGMAKCERIEQEVRDLLTCTCPPW